MKKYFWAFTFVLPIAAIVTLWGFQDKKQPVDYERIFSKILLPAPDTLSMSYLTNLPRLCCLFHDSFDRLDYTPLNDKTQKPLEKYSIGSETELGKNSFQDSEVFAYQEMANAQIGIGIKDNSIAFNHVAGNNKKERVIKYVDTHRSDYFFLFKRTTNRDTDAKIAFRIRNINNFYYVKVSDRYLDVYEIKEGKEKRLMRKRYHNNESFMGLVKDDSLYLYTNYRFEDKLKISDFKGCSLCGLLFTGNQRSEIDEFAIYYLDKYTDSGLDGLIEDGNIPQRNAHFGCEKGLITYNETKTCDSRRSLRFELKYYKDWESHKIGYSRRTELCPHVKNATSLDTWICSFDVYFPGIEDGDEYYADDKLDELFWQMHAPSVINMLSPNVALYLKDGIIRFEVLSRTTLRNDRQFVLSNNDYNYAGEIARLVDVESTNDSLREIKRGEWHNFTIFVKEGYTEAQLPRSIVYLDRMKVIDWFIPNSQNCSSPTTFLEFGIYKWKWAKSHIDSDIKNRVVYFDNIHYIR